MQRVEFSCEVRHIYKSLGAKGLRTKGTLHEDLRKFMIKYRRVLPRIRNVSYTVAEKIKTHILRSKTFPRTSGGL